MLSIAADLCAKASENNPEAHDAHTGEHDGLDAAGPRNERVDKDASAPGQACAQCAHERYECVLALAVCDIAGI
jgi:hypothetical protein